ncbi:hypothetical protein ADUPG1_005535, partial [Aduncisulcus paluster]
PILLGKPFINETGWFSDGLKGLPEVILDVEEEELDVAQGGEQTGEFDLTSTAPELKLEIERLIRMYNSGESPRGICQAEPFRIELTNTTPVHTAPRHLSATRRKALEPLIDDLLDRGAIVPSQSAYASPIVLVPKKDDKWRLCIDYRQLNECIVDVAYPLPRISDLLTHLTGQYYFAALDLV